MRRGITLSVLVALVAATVGVLAWRLSDADTGLHEALARRGRIAVSGRAPLHAITAPGTELVDAASIAPVATALGGTDPGALVAALRTAKIDALLVEASGAPAAAQAPLRARFAAYARVPAFRGLYLAPEAALYAPDPLRDLSAVDQQALAGVARGLLGGADPPRVTSFPERLRRVEPCEVMVLLRKGGRARLWRSARGSSMARALITAAVVARKRWAEREQAMGGPLDDVLGRIEVEVSLLADDGTLGSTHEAFVDRVIGPEHGVAYERKGAWRYSLPDATHEHGRPYDAYRALLAEDGLGIDALSSAEVRPYRLAVEVLARSPAPP